MKATDTFIDAVLRESYRKKHQNVPPTVRNGLIGAKRFVLDESASAFLSDLGHANFAPPRTPARLRRAFITSRQLARLPFMVTWIEYLPRAERARTLEAYPWAASSTIEADTGKWVLNQQPLGGPDKCSPNLGWLMVVHPRLECVFRASLFIAVNMPGTGELCPLMMPFDFIWSTDDDVALPYAGDNQLSNEQYDEMARCAFGAPLGKNNGQLVGYTRNEQSPNFNADDILKCQLEMSGELRKIVTLLASINDVPVGRRFVVPTHGFIAQGRYHKFLEHTVISLNIPKGRDPTKLARTIIAHARRRAHQVRGHWRRDWRHYGERIWIHEHLRGDPKLGFVDHSYKVEHDVAAHR
jgi:hypothetical protein